MRRRIQFVAVLPMTGINLILSYLSAVSCEGLVLPPVENCANELQTRPDKNCFNDVDGFRPFKFLTCQSHEIHH